MPRHAHPPLLLIAHGTRDPCGAEEMQELVALCGDRLGVPVAAAWLEDFAEPDAAAAAGPLVAAGAAVIVTVPLLAFAAGHAKTDVPAQLAALQRSHPGVDVRHGRVLGVHHELLQLAWQRVRAVSPQPAADEVLVVAASGSSDPDANGDLAKAARMTAEGTGHRWVEHAFAGVTWPRIEAVLERAVRAGAARITVFSWSLLAGLLEQRIWAAARQVAADTGVEVAEAGRFGPHRLLADAVAHRYAEALHGPVTANCDLCQFRVPYPRREQRVGAPSAGGTKAAPDPYPG